ncbi:undecaprenyldiphospho-muramoylpentapeptide beta-N-acetylglucosaminyltransferase [Aquimarina sp. W85]|uniref:undecaprenyldiphospho-muramoylpentapeptide beta-N-acetylglucosaminyltransferase n=1 Tax=Aquimarina rhodophyticola TaxID=3342246 RepID=UPI00366BA09D
MRIAPKIILSGGGTGGHIYPAIAIANEIRHRYPNAEILFVGAKDRMEMQKVPSAGYTIKGLWISGVQRKLTWSNLIFPLKLISSLLTSRKIIKTFKPNIAIGTGGFASGPLLRMAVNANVPTLLQEQNSYPGITNKWLAKSAHSICVAYSGLERFFPENKIKLTGNPVRQDLLDLSGKREKGSSKYGLSSNKTTLLVLGGSLGARRINQLIVSNLKFFADKNIQIIWQCGKLYFEEYKKYTNNQDVQVHQFIDTMDLAYASADIILSRAGAGSVSELCLVGKPVIFIPSPNVAEDHQTKNAQAIVDQDGALLVKEKDLDTTFQNTFKKLLEDSSLQKRLGETIQKLALPNATQEIVNEIESILKIKRQ